MGIRTGKNYGSCSGTSSTTYTLDGDKVLVEERSDGTILYFTYDYDGSLLSMNYNGDEYFYITNLQGDIIELVDINSKTKLLGPCFFILFKVNYIYSSKHYIQLKV